MKKTHIKILIVILLVGSTLFDFCFSQSNLLSVGNASGRIGSTNNILPISLSNQDTVAGLIFTVNYDPEKLTPGNITTVARTQNQSGLDFYIPTPGELLITMFDFDGNNVDPSSGEIIQVLFNVPNTAPAGAVPVSLTEQAISSTSYQSISVTVTNGVFEVISGPALAPPRNLTDQVIDDDVILNWDAPVSGKQGVNDRGDFIQKHYLTSLEGKKQYGSTKKKVQTVDIPTATNIDEVEPNNDRDEAQVLSGESPLLLNGKAEVDDYGVFAIVDPDDDIEDLFQITTITQGLRVTSTDLHPIVMFTFSILRLHRF